MRLVPAGFFVVRTPLLHATAYSGAPPETALKDPIVREAIGRASPSLLDEATQQGRNPKKAEPALSRYLARMRGRATPFALMTGYTHGEVGGTTEDIRLPAPEDSTRIVRLDTNCVAEVVHAWTEDRAVRARTSWIARRDLIRLEDVVRVSLRDPRDRDALTHLDVVRSTALDRALEASQSPSPFDAVVASVASFAPDEAAAAAYVHALIDRGLLVAAQHPSLADVDELARLETVDRGVADAARALRATPLSVDVGDRLEALRGNLSALRGGYSAGDVIFDVLKPRVAGRIGEDVVGELIAVIGVLQRVSRPMSDLRLGDFARAFAERHEDRDVSLVEALDPDRGYDFPIEPRFAPPDAAVGEWMLGLLGAACRAGATEIVLRDTDLPEKTLWSPEGLVSVTFRLAGDPRSIFEPQVDGAPGTGYFARATALLPELREATRALIREALTTETSPLAAEVLEFLPGRFAAFSQLPRLARVRADPQCGGWRPRIEPRCERPEARAARWAVRDPLVGHRQPHRSGGHQRRQPQPAGQLQPRPFSRYAVARREADRWLVVAAFDPIRVLSARALSRACARGRALVLERGEDGAASRRQGP